MIKNVVVVGAGVHFREKHYPVLEENNLSISLLVELARAQESVIHFFSSKKIQPQKYYFLTEKEELGFGQDIVDRIFLEYGLNEIHAMIISSEPSVRKSYLLWALTRNIDVFLDKPVLAFKNLSLVDSFRNDCIEVFDLCEKSQSNVVVCCERRLHPGYQFLFQYLQKLILEYGVFLTSVDIDFGGGVWKTQQEYLEDENHPFYLGYGILLHSGYHYIDLLEQLFSLLPTGYDKDQFSCLVNFPAFQDVSVEDTFGETDFFLMGQLLHSNGIKTTYTVKILGTSLSLREQFSKQFKLEGKIRQERVILHFGHLLSVHIESLPYKKIEKDHYSMEAFNITILQHPTIAKESLILRFDRKYFSDINPDLQFEDSMNSFARRNQLREFIHGRSGNSALCQHRKSMMRICDIYKEILKTKVKENHDCSLFDFSK